MKLSDFLRGRYEGGTRIRQYVFAAQIGVSPQTITGYCNGSIWPGREKMELIRAKTGGRVTADDFMQSEAAE